MKNLYVLANLYWVKIDSTSPYKSDDPLFILMYGSGGINLSAILPQSEMLAKYPGGQWFTRAKPDNL